MKIILLKNVPGVGQMNEVKNISDGYARNYILPRKLGKIATTSAIKHLASSSARTAEEKIINEDLLIKSLKSLEDMNVVVKEKANKKGHLFAGVGVDEVSSAIKNQLNINIDPEHIVLEHPIKEVGEHVIKVKFGENLVSFNLLVESVK